MTSVMSSEKVFYTIIAVIVVVGGIGIGAVYYHSVPFIHLMVQDTDTVPIIQPAVDIAAPHPSRP